MKRWAFLTTLLYLATLILLTAPALWLASIKWHRGEPSSWNFDASFTDVMWMYRNWGYWVWLGVMVASQALLLVVPIRKVGHRPTPRRPLLVPVLTVTFFLGNLLLAGICAILSAAMGDDAYQVFEVPAELNRETAAVVPGLFGFLTKLGLTPNTDLFVLFSVIGTMVMFWLIWGLIFYGFAKTDQPDALVRRMTRWLLRGSILELLVAVPSHIAVRHREDCCAPLATFWGIVTGVSVMLLSFGPGVFFLFAERMQRLKPKPPKISEPG